MTFVGRAAWIERIWYFDVWWRMSWPYVDATTRIDGWSA